MSKKTLSPKDCPACKGRATVDKDCRRCRRCYTALLFEGDSGFLNTDEPWFMFLRNGPRGMGWYQRGLLESAELLGPGGRLSSRMPAQDDGSDIYRALGIA